MSLLSKIKCRKILIFLVLLSALIIFCYRFFLSFTFLELVYSHKIWVHRVNSIEKLNEVKKEFTGVELDIVYIDSLDVFDVTHPPSPSIGLTLKAYLMASNENEINYWLDLKNLKSYNAQGVLKRLNLVLDQTGVDKSDIIMESPSAHLLSIFDSENYNTSYYFPWPGLYGLKGDTLNALLAKISKNLTRYNIRQISSNYHDYPLMKNHFPNQKKLLWLTGKKEHNSKLKERFFQLEILRDTTVKVLLMKYPTKTPER